MIDVIIVPVCSKASKALHLWYNKDMYTEVQKGMSLMSIEIIRGAIGSGKSSYILDSIEKKLNKDGRRHIVVVPEQFSYATEKQVVEKFGGAGLNNVEVITLSRMITRYMERRQDNYLMPSGKMMIVYKAVSNLPEDSLFFGCAKKPGFVESAAELISELVQHMISPEILRHKAEAIDNKLLKEKLIAVSYILEEYIRITSGKFFDSEEDILALAEFVEESNCFSDCDFWFDEFSVFLPQHYRIMQAFIKGGSEVHVAVCVDSEERELYEVNRSIIYKLEKMAENMGAELSEYRTDDVCRSIKSDEMRFLLQNIDRWSMPGFKAWEEETKDISLFVSKDLYKEVSYVASNIRRLVMEEGYRYRDIAVVCANVGEYEHIVEAVFNDSEIPYFSDTTLSTAEHPVSTLILSVFDILVENWSYASVFRYLRTGYPAGGDSESIDLLENYVLRYGIRGKTVWIDDEKWEKSQRGIFDGVLEKGDHQEFTKWEIEKINKIRKKITAPFIKLYESATGRKTVREFAVSLWNFIADIRLYEILRYKADRFEEQGLRNEAEQFRKIWNVLTETINQTVVVMGDEKVLREDYASILKAGLSAVNISIIPSGLDRVAVSSVERSRQHEAKVMFIMGAVFGAIPKESVANGIMTDNDRIILNMELEKDGMDIAADNSKRNDMDKFNFFSTLFGVSDRIYISYPAADAEGEVQRPAGIINEFYKVFPHMTAGDDIIEENEEDFLYLPRSAYRYMLTNYKRGGISADIYEWYKENMPEKLDVIKKASEYKRSDAAITPENAEKLYGTERSYSASRLSEYGKCPFGYFVKYGLRAKEQEIWQIQKFDLGSIMHLAVNMYCVRVDAGAESFEELKRNWTELTDQESDRIVAEVMEEIKGKILNGITRDEQKILYIIMRMSKIVERSVKLVRKSLSVGEYAAVCYEENFRVEVKWKGETVSVNGTIDRVDMAEVPEEKIAELRIVDYKTGRKSFSIVSVCNRQDIQLVLYAIAAVELYKSGGIKYAREDYEPRMRAVVYNNMRDDAVKVSSESEDYEALKAKESRPDGLVLLDMPDGKAYDTSSLIRMDSDIEKMHTSEVMHVTLTSSGSVDKRFSQVTTTDAFDLLMNYVRKTVIEIDKEIFDGVIKIYPSGDGTKKSCDMCDFGEICLYNELFDSTCRVAKNDAEAWNFITEEVGEDE